MEITNNSIQTVDVNDNILFTDTPVKGCPSIIHIEGSGLVTLRGVASTQSRARFRATFGANVAVPTGETVGPVTLALARNGESVATTTMIVTPAAVEEYFNISSSIFLDIPCGCCTQLSVKNISDIPVAVQNANLIIERVA